MTQKEQALHALQVASQRIGANAGKAGLYKVKRNRKGQVVQGYTLTPEHQAVVTAENALQRDEITPEEAMALLGEYEIFNARLKGY